jgi:hypothetical protein
MHDDLEEKGWATCFLCTRSFRITKPQGLHVLTASSGSGTHHRTPSRRKEPIRRRPAERIAA